MTEDRLESRVGWCIGALVSTIQRVVRRFVPATAREAIRTFLPDGPTLPPLINRYCVGQGIEVGAGKNPYCSPSNTVFLDRHTDNADGTPGADIITDTNAIPRPDETFDFLLSSHCLEHVPNTIKTLNEWIRVLKPEGILFLILPHAERTIDRFRNKTTLDHHIRDFETLADGPDRSHCEEITKGWSALPNAEENSVEYKRHWGADPWDWDFRFKNDVVHYHVWTQDEITRLFQYLGLRIIYANEWISERDDSFVVIARKPQASLTLTAPPVR